jgi:hypothetical protein
VIFDSDAPMDTNGGLDMRSNADKSVTALPVNEEQRNWIYFGNPEFALLWPGNFLIIFIP